MLTYGKDGPGDGLLLGFKRALTLFPGLIILFSISGFLMGETLMLSLIHISFASLCTRCAFLLSESESAWRTGTTASGAKQHGG